MSKTKRLNLGSRKRVSRADDDEEDVRCWIRYYNLDEIVDEVVAE